MLTEQLPPGGLHYCFRKLVPLGAQLTALHLLESPLLDNPGVTFAGAGLNGVEAGYPRYDAQAGRVYINKAGQHFEGVPPEVWAFHVGGYQVCERWLKDRRGRVLTPDDVRHYCRTAAALRETIRVQQEIGDVLWGRSCPALQAERAKGGDCEAGLSSQVD